MATLRMSPLSLMVYCSISVAYGQATCDGIQNGNVFYPEGVCLKRFVAGGSGISSHRVECDGNGDLDTFYYANSSGCTGDSVSSSESGVIDTWGWLWHWTCSPVCNTVAPANIENTAGCIAADAGVVGECEVAGGGPEDPAADACAAALGTGFYTMCENAVNAGGQFTAAQCVKGCEGLRRRRLLTSIDECGPSQNETCETECNQGSCGYIKMTTYWNNNVTFNESSCTDDVMDGAYFTETAKAINVCSDGVRYSCNDSHTMVYTFSDDDCTGEAQNVSVMTNDLECHGGYATTFECFGGNEDEDGSTRFRVSMHFVMVFAISFAITL